MYIASFYIMAVLKTKKTSVITEEQENQIGFGQELELESLHPTS
jgi:hypothetical protein